ncbi:hypothetical protein [Aestuariibacter sp. A3R04]|uniref:hypothetical protein n=1 Tax=Aestuariibacter sp. A3R04 TaxID=2841571 RepID=UPI001C082CC4|nr:hypothetical protein [Aestuariibacter sp. A3R04]MBU3020279.1 hypothetical protein [Aestuariibacter sp. A3R04]
MSQTTPQDSFSNRRNIMWVLLSGAMALLFIVMLFLPGASQSDSMLSVYSAMIWCGLFGATLFRYWNKNGWVGFAAGSVVGLVIQFTSQMFT